MRNFAKLLGIAVIAAVIGFSMTACGEEEEEKEKDVVVRFDSALYGGWQNGNYYEVYFSSEPDYDLDTVKFFYPNQDLPIAFVLIAKNGNTYTVKSSPLENFTAVVGSDGKLTISGLSEGLGHYNRTYTKQ